jgi:2-dehydro-3-deoxy-D-arabinonate dehydratase
MPVKTIMNARRVCRFLDPDGVPRPGLIVGENELLDLGAAGLSDLTSLLESDDPLAELTRLSERGGPRLALASVKIVAPVERQEVWAAGVTYRRSRAARMEESDFSASAYDRVYEAPRPELFFKALAEKVVSPGEPVGIRQDAKWSVPEPELALVLDSRGRLKGYTMGNDMSSRDIEGENLLYLPQAKVYSRSCALGPFVVLGATEAEARAWEIGVEIRRGGQSVFAGCTSVGNIKRSFTELAEWLFRCQSFPHGAILLTGTGVVPEGNFTLHPADDVRIKVSGIGVLKNPVVAV